MAKRQPFGISIEHRPSVVARKRGPHEQPLTHEERQALIRAPFMVERVIGKSWAGALISREELPIEGRRKFSPSPEDEEFGMGHALQITEVLDD